MIILIFYLRKYYAISSYVYIYIYIYDKILLKKINVSIDWLAMSSVIKIDIAF